MRTLPRLATTLGALAAAIVGTLAIAAPAHANTVISIEYQHANYGGASGPIINDYCGFAYTSTLNDVDVSTATLTSGWVAVK